VEAGLIEFGVRVRFRHPIARSAAYRAERMHEMHAALAEATDPVADPDDRDRWLIELLAQHRVLTAEQITALAFDHIKRAWRRLRLLCQRGVLARFRRHVQPGTQSWRYTLGPLGATVNGSGPPGTTARPLAITGLERQR
jgi:hypothetical protein